MIPTQYIFQPIDSFEIFEILNHVFVAFLRGIDTGFGSMDGKGKSIDDNHILSINLARHETHDFQIATRFRVHGHLQERKRRNVDLIKVLQTDDERCDAHSFNQGFSDTC